MSIRMTVMMDENLIKKVREIQAKKLRESTGSVSFSGVLNELLAKKL